MIDCLLFKPKTTFYIRKNALTLSPYHLFALTDNNNKVFGLSFFGKDNPIYIINNKTTNQKLINLLGRSKFDKLKDGEHYGVFCFKKIYHLNNRVSVGNVRGVRKAKDDETVEICREYVHQLLGDNEVTFKDVLYSKENFTKLYEYCMVEGLEGALFDLIREGVLR